MKFPMLKNLLTSLALVLLTPSLQAQFDDVYYDPDFHHPVINTNYIDSGSANTYDDSVTYYDNEEYGYYGDDDYYYSSRIKRFYSPYIGFGFYDPIYVSPNYYDPYALDYYGYPGANIYFGVNYGFNFGISFGFGTYWNNWYYPPYNYYAYGCGGSYPYGNYYNPYYSPYGYYSGSCGSGYYGGGCGSGYYGGHDDHHDGNGDYYYGPRVTGNTGSSPRGPVVPPGIASPVDKDRNAAIAQSNERPTGLSETELPGRSNPAGPTVLGGIEQSPANAPFTRGESNPGVVKPGPVVREPSPDAVASTSKRPVFRPYPEKFQSSPTSERTKPASDTPVADNHSTYRPYTPQNKPAGAPKDNYRSNPQAGQPNQAPVRVEQMPSYTPPTRSNNVRPSYSPPPRSNDRPAQTEPARSNDKPNYSPSPSGNNESRSNDKPSYSSPSSNDNQRSNSSSSHSSSSSSSNRSSSPSGGSRSSGGSSGSSTSPRGKG